MQINKGKVNVYFERLKMKKEIIFKNKASLLKLDATILFI